MQVPSSARAPRQLGVVLVEPLHVVRAGMLLFISAQEDMEVVAEAASADEAFAAMQGLRRRRDVMVLVSLGIDGPHDAFWLIRSVRDTFPSMSILACGASPDGLTVSRALFTGADGFLDKAVTADEFLTSIRDVGSSTGVVVALKRAMNNGLTPGPRMWVAGTPLGPTGGHAVFEWLFAAARARSAVPA